MKVSMILGLGLALAMPTAFGQQPQPYHAKKSHVAPEKASKAAPPVKTPSATTDTSRELKKIEQQSMKANAGVKTGPKHTPAIRPEKERAPAPIVATGGANMGTNTKGTGTNSQSKNPYKGRLKQKGSHN